MSDKGRPDQAFYEAVIASSPLVVLLVSGTDGSITYISANARRAVGRDDEWLDAPGRSWLDILHPEDRVSIEASFWALAADPDEDFSTVARVVRGNGDERWVAVRFRADPSGSDDLFGFFIDVHERMLADREADRQRNLLQAVLDHAHVSVQVKDLDGRFLVANRRIEEDFGLEPGVLIGLRLHDIWPAAEADIFAANDAAVVEEDGPLQIEEVAEHADGPHTYVSTKFPLRDASGKTFAVGGIATDITARIRVEEELRRSREEAERANRAKSEFLSRMSHELRTPLNSILGFAQLLELDDLPPDHAEAVDHILRGGRHLLSLINEVLDISRIEAGTMALSLEPVALDTMIEECLELVRPQARARSIELVNDDGRHRHVQADRQRLRQVMLNLLSNAVKFNHDGGTITVSCEHEDESVRILVTDTGSGIRADRLDRLFTPFDRLDADAAGVQGTGLGLALSLRLVEAMHGTIEVESEPGVGSTFSFVLPVGEPEQVADRRRALRRPRPPDASVVATVLYIEDNLSNLRLVEQVLERRPSVRLVSALQGSLGLELAAQHRPDLILLDVHLPDLAGDEVLARLKADPATADVPVVVVSADATSGHIKRFAALGAEEYLTKPLDIAHLLDVLDRHLAP